MKWLGRIALLAIATILAAELFLQLGALLVSDRSGFGGEADGRIRILCVGDSHTYGAGVKRVESYPGQLQLGLDRAAPGRFRVVNRGVPGFTTTNVRLRLPKLMEVYHPQMLWLWAGINDTWNRAEVDQLDAAEVFVAERSPIERLLDASRLVKLYRVRRHRALLVSEIAFERVRLAKPEDGDRGIRFESEEGEDTVGVEGVEGEEQLVRAARMRDNYEAIIAIGEEAGIPVGFISYPIPYPTAAGVNHMIEAVAAAEGVALVNSFEAMKGFSEEERFTTLGGAHPTAIHYREIAKGVARATLAALPMDRDPDRGRDR